MLSRLFKPRLPFKTVRGRFSATMGVSGVVFGLLLTAFMAWRWELSLKDAARETLQITAHKIARSLITDMHHRQQEVALLAEIIGTSQVADAKTLRQMFNNLLSRQAEYAWIGLATQDGTVTVASGGLLEGKSVQARPWFQGGLQGVFLGDPHEAVMLARYLKPNANDDLLRFVDVALPVRDRQGNHLGVLGAHLHWQWIQGLVNNALADLEKSTPVQVLIASQDGKWILKPATEPASDLNDLQTHAKPGQYFSAQTVVQTSVTQNGLAWTVIVREEAKHTLAPIVWNRQLMFAISTIVAALFAAATWLICGWVVGPIVSLVHQARAHQSFRAARLNTDIPQQLDETRVLGNVMHQLAYFDAVTGLANRRLLLERLQEALQACADGDQCGAVLLVNLDNFSLFNDTKGHEMGDQLLLEVGQRLTALLTPEDSLARLGSDEFMVMRRNVGHNAQIAQQKSLELAGTVLKCLTVPFELGGEPYRCNASIGVTLFGSDAACVPDIFKQTDVAMFEAKRAGGNRVQFFDARLQTRLNERFALELALRKAIPGQLFIVFQKQVDAHAQVIGAEVLLRWRHPEMGLISPQIFIPLAEETGQIIDIGQWVLRNACQQIKTWESQERFDQLVLAVNVSVKEFSQPDFVQQVLGILRASGANPRRLKLELTESVLAQDVDSVVEKMKRLKAVGVSFSLDDFGTGFSSLAYLKKMPLDQLKIDQAFIRDVDANTNDMSIVRAVIALGAGLGLTVIAEGVETEAQHRFLRANQCPLYQGYLFGRPVPLAEFEVGAWEPAFEPSDSAS